MKRLVAVAFACVALAFVVASCSSGGGDDDAKSPDDTKDTIAQDPESVLIAEQAMLTSADFPSWWEFAEVSDDLEAALLEPYDECDALLAAQLTSTSKQAGRAGPIVFMEPDHARRVDLVIRVYEDTARAEEVMAALGEGDTPGCLAVVVGTALDTAAGGAAPPDSVGQAEWAPDPAVGDQALEAVIPVTHTVRLPLELSDEPGTYHFVWVRVDRAVFQVSFVGPPEDSPETYVNTVATRLSEQLAGAGTPD